MRRRIRSTYDPKPATQAVQRVVGKRTLAETRYSAVQASGALDGDRVHAAADAGVLGVGERLPFMDVIYSYYRALQRLLDRPDLEDTERIKWEARKVVAMRLRFWPEVRVKFGSEYSSRLRMPAPPIRSTCSSDCAIWTSRSS